MKLSPTRERKDNQYPDDDDEPEKTHPNDTREDRRDELHCSGHDGEQRQEVPNFWRVAELMEKEIKADRREHAGNYR